jgi:hypothetical protein
VDTQGKIYTIIGENIMYRGFNIIVKTGEAGTLKATTDDPFKWFPELKPLFKNFDIEVLEFEVKSKEKNIIQNIFKIRKF